MATTNPFALLDDNTEDPNLVIAAQELKVSAAIATVDKKVPAAPNAKPAKLPSKPIPPAQAVREARNEGGRGGGGRGGRGYVRGRGPGGASRDFAGNDDSFASENGGPIGTQEERGQTERRGGFGGPRGGYRGGRRGGFGNGEVAEGERPRRTYERRSGTGRGSGEFKREGAGRGNWGSPTDVIAPETVEPAVDSEATAEAEKPEGEVEAVDAVKETPEKEAEVVDPEEKQMTLEEYGKVLEEKRKALQALKTEERKVDLDKDFESMQLVSKKKIDDEVFIKLSSDKDKRKEAADKEEKAKKSVVSIDEFLGKNGSGSNSTRGGRGRGRGGRGGNGGGYGMNNASAPKIEDPNQFPSLGAN